MEPTQYHVLLEGRAVGPYDRRMVIGMRIRKTLASSNLLIGADGSRLTVGDLIGQPPEFNPNRSGSFSLVQATYTAALLGVEGRGMDIPRFRGEMEARVQSDVLRLAGRFRHRFQWKEDRVKLPISDIVHARLQGSVAELWLRGRAGLQRLTLELFSPRAAGEFVDWLPNATPFPDGDARSSRAGVPPALIVAAFGVIVTVGIVLMAVLRLR